MLIRQEINKEIMTLRLGKHKGQQFKAPKQEKPLHQQLNGWDGNNRKGEAIYEAIFEQEKSEMQKIDCIQGICSCCEGGKYYGL